MQKPRKFFSPWRLVAICFVCLFPVSSYAHAPVMVATPAQNDIIPLEEPDLSKAFYGDMQNYPQMYEFRTTDTIHLHVEVLVPDIHSAQNNVSGIILRVRSDGGVKEVARLRAPEASWKSFFEPWGGDSYRRGQSYDGDIEPGLYRIEVSTPDDIGKYVLVVGQKESFSIFNYFPLIGKISDVKVFFGKSRLLVIESPLVYVPVLAFGLLGGLWWYRRRSRVLST